ncbi:MAG: hypothetical protein H7338_23935 [Candidatus Sericytochromatia bacterium]|nr:hypothetical protein [Candidatus Sericytochromatia bacterium]
MRLSSAVLSIFLAVGLPIGPVAFAAPAEPPAASQPLSQRARSSLQAAQKAWERGDIAKAEEGLRSVRMIMAAANVSTVSADVVIAAMGLRRHLARSGGNVGTWSEWSYDGLDAGDAAAEVAAIDVNLAMMRAALAKNDTRAAEGAMVAVERALAANAFSGNQVLTLYRTNLGGPTLFGLRHHLGELRATRVAVLIHAANTAMGIHDEAKALQYGRRAQLQISQMRALLFDPTDFIVTLDPKKAGERIRLDKAIDALGASMKTAKNAEAFDKANNAAQDQSWKAVLSGEKADLYTKFGPPSEWDVSAEDWQPETAVKSPWWAYHKLIAPNYLETIFYEFDTAGRVTRRDQYTAYVPY